MIECNHCGEDVNPWTAGNVPDKEGEYLITVQRNKYIGCRDDQPRIRYVVKAYFRNGRWDSAPTQGIYGQIVAYQQYPEAYDGEI